MLYQYITILISCAVMLCYYAVMLYQYITILSSYADICGIFYVGKMPNIITMCFRSYHFAVSTQYLLNHI